MVTSPYHKIVTMVTVPELLDTKIVTEPDHVDMDIDGGPRRPSFLTSFAESAIDYISCRRLGHTPDVHVNCK